jgi:hypothetical protein
MTFNGIPEMPFPAPPSRLERVADSLEWLLLRTWKRLTFSKPAKEQNGPLK